MRLIKVEFKVEEYLTMWYLKKIVRKVSFFGFNPQHCISKFVFERPHITYFAFFLIYKEGFRKKVRK